MLVVVVVLLLLALSGPSDAIPQARHRPAQHTATSQKSLLSSIYSAVNPSGLSSRNTQSARDADERRREPTYGARSSTFTHKKPSSHVEHHPLRLLSLQSPGPVRSVVGGLVDDISRTMTDILSFEIIPTRNQPLDLLEPHAVTKLRQQSADDLSDRLLVSYTPGGSDVYFDGELMQEVDGANGTNGTDNATEEPVILECNADSFQREAYRDAFVCNNVSYSLPQYTELTGLFPNGSLVDPATGNCDGANQTLQDAYQVYVAGQAPVPAPAAPTPIPTDIPLPSPAPVPSLDNSWLSFDDWRSTVCNFNNETDATLPDGVVVPDDADLACRTYTQCEARPTCTRTQETTQFCVCPRDRRGVLCNERTPYQCSASLVAPQPDCREGYKNFDGRMVGAPPCYFVEPEKSDIVSESDEMEVDSSAVGRNGRFEFQHAVTCEFVGSDIQTREGPGWDLEGDGWVWNTSDTDEWQFNYTIGDSNSSFAWTGNDLPRLRMKIFNMNTLFDDSRVVTSELSSDHIADAENQQPLGISFQLSQLGADHVTSGRVYAEFTVVTSNMARISPVVPYHVEVLGYELPPSIPPSTLVIALVSGFSVLGFVLAVTIVSVYCVRRRKRLAEEAFFIEHGYFPGDSKRKLRHGERRADGSDQTALLGDLDADEEEAIRRREGRASNGSGGGSGSGSGTDREEVELEPLGASSHDESDAKDESDALELEGGTRASASSFSGSVGSFRQRLSMRRLKRRTSGDFEEDDDDVVLSEDVEDDEDDIEEQLSRLGAVEIVPNPDMD